MFCWVMASFSLLLLATVMLPLAYSHGLGLHAVDGEPGAVPILPDITGPFEAEVTFRMRDDMTSFSFMRLFDFCMQGANHVVALGQVANTKTLMLEIVTANAYYVALTDESYEQPADVLTTLRAGVDPNGQLWIQVDSGSRSEGDIMKDVAELDVALDTKLIGRSCFGDDDLRGAIVGIRISPHGESHIGVEQQRFQNHPAQILGPFTVSFWARMDNLSTVPNQSLFSFSNGVHTNDVFMANNSSDPSEMVFCIYLEGGWKCISWANSVVEGEVALWHAGVRSNGAMWIEKHGEITGSSSYEVAGRYDSTWKREIRTQMKFGEPHYDHDSPLNGFILGFQLDGVSLS